jgi:hypothetical protein
MKTAQRDDNWPVRLLISLALFLLLSAVTSVRAQFVASVATCQMNPLSEGCPLPKVWTTPAGAPGVIDAQDRGSISGNGDVTGTPSAGSIVLSWPPQPKYPGDIPLGGGWTGMLAPNSSVAYISTLTSSDWSGTVGFEVSLDGSTWFPAICQFANGGPPGLTETGPVQGSLLLTGSANLSCFATLTYIRVRAMTPVSGSMRVWFEYETSVMPISNGDFPQ